VGSSYDGFKHKLTLLILLLLTTTNTTTTQIKHQVSYQS